MKKVLFMVVLSLVMSAGWAKSAKSIHPEITMLTLVSHDITEKNFDQVYVDIASYYSNSQFKHSRKPDKPFHWIMKQDQVVPEQQLWAGSLKEGESVRVVLSLIEHDRLRFDPDDFIGTAVVLLKNKNGRLVSEWKIPNSNEQPEKIDYGRRMSKYRYQMMGEGGHYQLDLTAGLQD